MPQKLGQHFLKNEAAIKKIVAALDLQPGETIVEIGPGHGELTDCLLASPAGKIIAIEKDSSLAENLRSQILDSRFQVITGDILKILPKIQDLKSKIYKLVGNIPYYITGFLFRIIGELENKPSLIVFTIQKEVAERIVAKPPRMNLLAASVQIWAEPEILMTLPPEDFDPPPKVTSAIIKLKTKNNELGIMNNGNYYKLIKIIFKQPRKTLFNNIRTSDVLTLGEEEIKKRLEKIDLTGEERGQDLSIEKLVELSIVFPTIPNS